MAQRRKFSAEYKREAVAMLESPGVSVQPDRRGTGDWGECLRTLASGIAPGVGIRRLQGNGRPRDEELALLRRELARVTKERDFLREAAAFFARASR